MWASTETCVAVHECAQALAKALAFEVLMALAAVSLEWQEGVSAVKQELILGMLGE